MPTTLSRSLLTVIIPGLVATAPWLVFLVQHTEATFGAEKSSVLSNAFIFALVVVVGSTCEGLGTYLEFKWDAKLEEKYKVNDHWLRYLRYSGEHEPVAFRYLSRLVTTLYFELAMLFAATSFALGATVLASLRFEQQRCWIIPSGIAVAVLLAVYFRYQAKQTHSGICKLRHDLDLPAVVAGGTAAE